MKTKQNKRIRFGDNCQALVQSKPKLEAGIIKLFLLQRAPQHFKEVRQMCGAILPKGPIQLVDFAMEQWFNQFSQKLQSSPLKEMGMTNRIRTGILLRLNQVKPYQKTWPQAMSLGVQPAYLPQTLRYIHRISDQIWYRAGDTSLDYNWYTKRGLLSSLYISTELFMIQDNSENFQQTEQYLDRRLQDILSMGQGLVNGRNFGSAVVGGLLSLGQSFLLPLKQTKDVSKLISQIQNSFVFNKESQREDGKDNKDSKVSQENEDRNNNY